MHKYQLTLNSLWKYVNEIFGDVDAMGREIGNPVFGGAVLIP
jgi:hypothetical protein